jgi:hypothetical protein
MKNMSIGSWIVVAVLAILLAWSGLVAFREWSRLQDVRIPPYGYAAMILDIRFSLIVGAGLMAPILYSSRYGSDEPPKLLNDGDQGSG